MTFQTNRFLTAESQGAPPCDQIDSVQPVCLLCPDETARPTPGTRQGDPRELAGNDSADCFFPLRVSLMVNLTHGQQLSKIVLGIGSTWKDSFGHLGAATEQNLISCSERLHNSRRRRWSRSNDDSRQEKDPSEIQKFISWFREKDMTTPIVFVLTSFRSANEGQYSSNTNERYFT